MECELCEKEDELVDAIVEGKPLRICRECARFRDIVLVNKPSKERLAEADRPYKVVERLKQFMPTHTTAIEPIVVKVEDKLKQARRRKGLSTTQLADSIGADESEIVRIERGEGASTELLKKLEQFLNIKLQEEHEKEKPEDKEDIEIDFRDKSLKVNDLLKAKKKLQEN